MIARANLTFPKFVPIITTGFGFSVYKALLLQMPIGGAEIVFLLISSVVATLIPSTRILCMVFNTIVAMVGMLLVWKLAADDAIGRMVGLTLSIVYAINIPLSLSLIASNVAGFSKKSVVSALLFIAYCAGNIVGPQLFIASEAPSYPVCIPTSSESHSSYSLFHIDRGQSMHFRIRSKCVLPALPVRLLCVGEQA